MTWQPDSLIHEVLKQQSCGLDLDKGSKTLEFLMEALEKQAQELKDAVYKGATDLAKTANHTAKTLDALCRLMQFAKGQPDSRPDLGGDWMRALTDDQLEQVALWVEENRAKHDEEVESVQRRESN